MTVFDTSSLIRFFTNDIPEKAIVVKKVIDSDEKVLIPDVVFPALEYVLLGEVYKSSRQKVLQAFHFLISRKKFNKLEKLPPKAIVIFIETRFPELSLISCKTSVS